MLYALYNENGSIHQANKLYDDPEKYDAILNDLGHKFVKVNAPGLLPPEHWYVDVKAQELCERPVMPITVSKTRVKCGNDDSSLLTNCPNKSRFTITTSNVEIHSGVLDATELQLFIPVPCVYKVKLDLWPYKAFELDIEAVA